MPQTESTSIQLGSPAPDFALPDARGASYRLSDFVAAPALLIAFWSNRCPFVLHLRDHFAAFARTARPRGLEVVAINSNDETAHPEESLPRMAEAAAVARYGFPYLKDAGQAVAQAIGAACTPEFFLYGPDRRLAYHGQYDASRPKNGLPVTGADLQAAVEAVLAGRAPEAVQVPAIGCNIKWRAQTPRPAVRQPASLSA